MTQDDKSRPSDPFTDPPAKKPVSSDMGRIVNELRDVLSNLGSEKPPEEPEAPSDTDALRLSSESKKYLEKPIEPPPFADHLKEEPLPPGGVTSDAEFWNGNVLGWPNGGNGDTGENSSSPSPEPLATPSLEIELGNNNKNEEENLNGGLLGTPTFENPLEPFGSPPPPIEESNPPKESNPELSLDSLANNGFPFGVGGMPQGGIQEDSDVKSDSLTESFDTTSMPKNEVGSLDPSPSSELLGTPDLASSPFPPSKPVSDLEPLADSFPTAAEPALGTPDSFQSAGDADLTPPPPPFPEMDIPIPETTNSRPHLEEEPDHLHLDSKEIKPKELLQVACVYPEGCEIESQGFIKKLRTLLESTGQTMKLDLVFTGAWKENSFDMAAWEQAATLSGAELMFVILPRESAVLIPADFNFSKNNLKKRRIFLEQLSLKTIYADILVDLKRGR